MLIEDRFDLTRIIIEEEYKTIVEVGAGDGEYSEWLLYYTPCKKLYSIDKWVDVNGDDEYFHHEKAEKKCRERLAPFEDRSVIMKTTSKEASEHFEPHSVDFCFIDAGKDWRSVKDDLIYWYDKVKPKGILAGKDYCLLPWEGCSVMAAVDSMCRLMRQELRVTHTTSLDPMVRHHVAQNNSPIGVEHNIETPTWWIKKTEKEWWHE
jgi:predicted O-methyltransferase YrrM